MTRHFATDVGPHTVCDHCKSRLPALVPKDSKKPSYFKSLTRNFFIIQLAIEKFYKRKF